MCSLSSPPDEWSVDEVSAWISTTKYGAFSAQFESAGISGPKLLSLNRKGLRHKVKITDGTDGGAECIQCVVTENAADFIEMFLSKNMRSHSVSDRLSLCQ